MTFTTIDEIIEHYSKPEQKQDDLDPITDVREEEE